MAGQDLPREFRAEHETEMVQNFRELCRERLDHLSSTRMVGLWGHAFLDLAASAAIEHVRRRKPMNTLDQTCVGICGTECKCFASIRCGC